MDPHPGNPHLEPADTVMSGHGATATGSRSFIARFLGRRRTYVVDRGYQMRTAVVSVLGMLFLLLFAAALFHLLTLENARMVARRAPFLSRAASENDARSILYLVAAGIIFVAAVFVIEILETHKTAGVVYKVTRGLRELEAGHWGARVQLRRNDNFREMEEAFNAAARCLREQVDDDLRALQAIEGQVRLIGREFETGNREGALVLLRQVAGELQRLKERKRNLLEIPTSNPPASKI